MRIDIALALLCMTGCQNRAEPELSIGRTVVSKIERYRKEQGKLPSSLDSIGMTTKIEGPIYYEKKDSDSYILWFGTELGESITYDSKSRIWR